jgi:glycosyltransferase involved in cell wall biosynthesis
LGDKWLLKSTEGDVVSAVNTLYKVNDVNFDVIHLNHKPITEHYYVFYPNTPMVCTIHSEVIALEEPVPTTQVNKKNIAIRPEIKKYIVDDFNVDSNLVEVVYNPIDNIRFKLGPEQHRVKKRILFVGTIDYLRKKYNTRFS